MPLSFVEGHRVCLCIYNYYCYCCYRVIILTLVKHTSEES